MKQFTRISATLGIAAMALAACSGSDGNGGSEDESASGGDVIFYSSESAMPDLAEQFMKNSDTKVKILDLSSGESDQRTLAEAGNPQADLALSGSEPSHNNPELYRKFEPIIGGKEQFAEYILDDDYAIPLMAYPTMFAYSAELIEDLDIEPPTTWADLADPALKDSVGIGDPASSAAAYKVIASIYASGGWELVEQVAQNFVIAQSSLGPTQAVADGEVAVATQVEVGIYKVADGTNVVPVYPTDGSIMHPGYVYLIEGGPNSEGADEFINWLVSEDAQGYMSENYPGMRSTLADPPKVTSVPSLDELNVIELPEEAADRDSFLAKWEEIRSTL